MGWSASVLVKTCDLSCSTMKWLFWLQNTTGQNCPAALPSPTLDFLLPRWCVVPVLQPYLCSKFWSWPLCGCSLFSLAFAHTDGLGHLFLEDILHITLWSTVHRAFVVNNVLFLHWVCTFKKRQIVARVQFLRGDVTTKWEYNIPRVITWALSCA